MRPDKRAGGHAGPPLHLHKPMLALVLLVVLAPAPTLAQHQTEPHPLDTFLTNVLNFTNPTGIRGTIRYIDLRRTGPLVELASTRRRSAVIRNGMAHGPGEALLAVHPHPSESIVDLRALRNGTAVELIIQLDSHGKRRILSFRAMSRPPDVPL